MNRQSSWSRRGALGVLAALCSHDLLAAAPSAPPAAPLVSVPASPEAAEPPGDDGARLETAFDAATRISVPVYINGEGPFPFVVDSGANSSVIGLETAKALGLPVVASAPIHGILSAQPAPMVAVRSLQVGSVRSRDLRLPVIAEASLGVAGLLGVDMLRGRRMELDFEAKGFAISPSLEGPATGRLEDTHLFDPTAPVVVPARIRSGQLIIIDASAALAPIVAFLDTGSQVTVANGALRSLVSAAQPKLGEALIHSSLVSATGQRAQADFGPLPSLRVGRLLIDAPLVAFSDLHIFSLWRLQRTPSLLLGVDLLRRFRKIAFDYGRRELTLWPKRQRA